MKTSFAEALRRVYLHEGNYSDHPDDPGGKTMWGITKERYDSYRKLLGLPKQDVRKITKKEADDIYRRFYWDVIRGDDLPLGVDYAAFDTAVNSGPPQAAKFLQRAIGVPADGNIGVVTLQKLDDLGAHGDVEGDRVINSMTAQRQEFVRRLKNYSSFSKGWERRIKEVQTAALSMNNRRPVAEPTTMAAEDTGKALARDTKLTETPEAEQLIQQSSSWGLTTIMGYVQQSADYLSLLTGLPAPVIRVVAITGMVVGAVGIIGFAAYGIYRLFQLRKNKEDVVSS